MLPAKVDSLMAELQWWWICRVGVRVFGDMVQSNEMSK
jgi:hypothetical protein